MQHNLSDVEFNVFIELNQSFVQNFIVWQAIRIMRIVVQTESIHY